MRFATNPRVSRFGCRILDLPRGLQVIRWRQEYRGRVSAEPVRRETLVNTRHGQVVIPCEVLRGPWASRGDVQRRLWKRRGILKGVETRRLKREAKDVAARVHHAFPDTPSNVKRRAAWDATQKALQVFGYQLMSGPKHFVGPMTVGWYSRGRIRWRNRDSVIQLVPLHLAMGSDPRSVRPIRERRIGAVRVRGIIGRGLFVCEGSQPHYTNWDGSRKGFTIHSSTIARAWRGDDLIHEGHVGVVFIGERTFEPRHTGIDIRMGTSFSIRLDGFDEPCERIEFVEREQAEWSVWTLVSLIRAGCRWEEMCVPYMGHWDLHATVLDLLGRREITFRQAVEHCKWWHPDAIRERERNPMLPGFHDADVWVRG